MVCVYFCPFCRVSDDYLPSDDEEDEDDHGGPETDGDEGSSGNFRCSSELIASFSQSTFTLKKPLNQKLLDSRVLKALKKQEERKEMKSARKREAS